MPPAGSAAAATASGLPSRPACCSAACSDVPLPSTADASRLALKVPATARLPRNVVWNRTPSSSLKATTSTCRPAASAALCASMHAYMRACEIVCVRARMHLCVCVCVPQYP